MAATAIGAPYGWLGWATPLAGLASVGPAIFLTSVSLISQGPSVLRGRGPDASGGGSASTP